MQFKKTFHYLKGFLKEQKKEDYVEHCQTKSQVNDAVSVPLGDFIWQNTFDTDME